MKKVIFFLVFLLAVFTVSVASAQLWGNDDRRSGETYDSDNQGRWGSPPEYDRRPGDPSRLNPNPERLEPPDRIRPKQDRDDWRGSSYKKRYGKESSSSY